MKKYIFTLLILNLLSYASRADEGMWLLPMLEEIGIENKGCQLTVEQIHSLNHSCLRDAIVGLGSEERPFRFFCSGEIVSNQGLVFTNHHCAYASIQQHSSLDNNLLEKGFWAETLADELPNKGLTAAVVQSIEDVSSLIVPHIDNQMPVGERNRIIDSLCLRLTDSVEASNANIRANVNQFYNHNQFLLFTYLIYKDVRLVGTPPESIGRFGGDTDNWQWKRHTGDFAILRIYADTAGNPQAYNEANVPLRPKHFLPLSIGGINENDFTMIMGFPGSTQRYLLASQLANLTSIKNQTTYDIRSQKLNIMRQYMEQDEKTRLQYANKWSTVSNYWKYANEQNQSIEQRNVKQQKEAIEARWRQNATADSLINEISEIEKELAEYERAKIYYREVFTSGIEAVQLARQTSHLLEVLKEKNQSQIASECETLRPKAEDFFKNYSPYIDHDLTATLLQMFSENVEARFCPDLISDIKKQYIDFEHFADQAFATSIFGYQEKFLAFLENPKAKTLTTDPIYKLMSAADNMLKTINSTQKPLTDRKTIASRQLSALQLQNKWITYPDANSTLRLSYGQIAPYEANGTSYEYISTFSEMIAKADSSNREFRLPAKLFELYQQNQFAPYADDAQTMPICFISTNDITGGNSGSGVINSRGELIGIAFDGNREAMCGDIIFSPDIQRCINVDIRFVLFIIDKFAHAQRIIDELDIRK